MVEVVQHAVFKCVKKKREVGENVAPVQEVVSHPIGGCQKSDFKQR